MLKLPHKRYIQLPHLHMAPSQPMHFAPVHNDHDELTQAIADDTSTHDDNWTLNERPDSRGLEQFWATVEDDILHDPEWLQISESEG